VELEWLPRATKSSRPAIQFHSISWNSSLSATDVGLSRSSHFASRLGSENFPIGRSARSAPP
jgi:hypothetical protein